MSQELVSEVNKVTGYQINIQKSIVYLFINEHMETNIKNITPFEITQKNEILRYKSNYIYTGIVHDCDEKNQRKSK